MTPDLLGEGQELLAHIQGLVAREGPITFRRFMALALYHPHYGYYTRPGARMGREGDYVTSPEVHPVFGYAVAEQVLEMWEAMGRPRPFTLVEPGAGTGALAQAVLRWARQRASELYDSLRYVLLEASPHLRDRQRQALAAYEDRVSWRRSLPRGIVGCFLQNELFDSFPVHRVAVEGGALREVYVDFREGRLQELLGAPSTPRLAAYFRRLGIWSGEGCRAEVNLAALDFMARIARALERGFALTFDYGYEAQQIFVPWRREGTLMAFYRHNPSHDPYARPGRQDLTSHVDFTSLIEAGRRHGLEPLGLTTQARFLSALGIGQEMAQEEDLEGYYARRRALVELLDPASLGRIKVLLQAKGVARVSLRGLEESNEVALQEALCHSERSEESTGAQSELREGSQPAGQPDPSLLSG